MTPSSQVMEPCAYPGRFTVQSFIGMAQIHHRADIGMFVTTSTFTQLARDLARKHGVQLIEGSSLVEMIVKEHQRRNKSSASAHALAEVPPPNAQRAPE